MTLNARHEQIVELVGERGFMTIEALTEHFNVTPQTIRRDLNTLDEAGRLRRYHGGAGLSASTRNLAYAERRIRNLDEKQRIAATIAERVPDNSSLFINIGTTTETIAKALLEKQGLTVITNNLHVASILCSRDDFTVIIAGGMVRNRDGGVIGEATEEFVRQFKVDIAIIGISGIDGDGDLLDFDYQEVRVAQAIIEHSRQVYLAADHTKFGRNAMIRLGHISQATHLFTDSRPHQRLSDTIAQAGVKLVIAN
ncbi:DeoR/GlpR family DNA-binding transcription regulator [Marinobacter sp. CA1]|uniref:DeoR/GlpR family DNA-binding transcription regulator n=1 Tax=Marinobacter sp. CA1 TaxID=2817656 RepID=UPI001D078C52|nr:DeoR family transcriptional regulator [Marinobacter sp. CA1]UDL04194.1 DeoR family transcriptional regulator [Marinobacter sp. CA1]